MALGTSATNAIHDKIENTQSGVQIEKLTLFMYPTGHGYLTHPGKDELGRNISVPADNPAKMVAIFAELVSHALKRAQARERLELKRSGAAKKAWVTRREDAAAEKV